MCSNFYCQLLAASQTDMCISIYFLFFIIYWLNTQLKIQDEGFEKLRGSYRRVLPCHLAFLYLACRRRPKHLVGKTARHLNK